MIKTVIEIDQDALMRLESNIEAIRRGLENINLVPPASFLTPAEFRSQIKASKWTVHMMLRSGQLEYKKIGRKVFIPQNQVAKYFAGGINLR